MKLLIAANYDRIAGRVFPWFAKKIQPVRPVESLTRINACSWLPA